MFFRNITFFRFPRSLRQHMRELAQGTADADEQLAGLLGECALKPVGPSELMSRGWVPPLGGESAALYHLVGDAVWICLGGEDRMLPAAAVNRELQQRLAQIEQQEGRRLGGRARKRLKEDIVAGMLPRAFVKPSRLNAYLDLERGLVAIDTTSRKAAEHLVSWLRYSLGSFPALPLSAEVSPRAVLTGALGGNPMGEALALGDEAELRDPVEGGGRVRVSGQELPHDEVQAYIAAGLNAVRVGLAFEDRVSFTFGEDLVLRKVKFLDGAVDSLADQEHEDLAAELDARFALMAGEVGRLFDVLEQVFGLSTAEG